MKFNPQLQASKYKYMFLQDERAWMGKVKDNKKRDSKLKRCEN